MCTLWQSRLDQDAPWVTKIKSGTGTGYTGKACSSLRRYWIVIITEKNKKVKVSVSDVLHTPDISQSNFVNLVYVSRTEFDNKNK